MIEWVLFIRLSCSLCGCLQPTFFFSLWLFAKDFLLFFVAVCNRLSCFLYDSWQRAFLISLWLFATGFFIFYMTACNRIFWFLFHLLIFISSELVTDESATHGPYVLNTRACIPCRHYFVLITAKIITNIIQRHNCSRYTSFLKCYHSDTNLWIF